ncbi:hypothetical protein POV27_06080 [Aureisphaera galaxeae]|uniref:hypothetical protein n=1 Tax=Aureisphaera galaxeae TaxID=1538023 RepID=UPI002351058D|nr:hypothetical protein [Aureisphaera galaxeae]MDC8003611.1 hypothetical protein [Aureisphaera galaxeae]
MDFSSTINAIHIYAAHLATCLVAINCILCIVAYKKMSIPFKRLTYFLLWNLLIEILAITFMELGRNNLPLLHIYTLGEFLLFSYFYKSVLHKPKIFQSHYMYFILGVSILIILNSAFIQNIFNFNTIAKTLVQVIIISYSVFYFYNLVENQRSSDRMAKSLRLINSAIMIYYSGSLFIFMCSKISFENTDTYIVFWAFNAILNVIFHLLILWGVWIAFFRKNRSSH